MHQKQQRTIVVGRNSPLRKGSNISNKQLAYWYIVHYSLTESSSFDFLGYRFLPAYHLGNPLFQGNLFVPFWESAPEIQRCTPCLPSNGCVLILPLPFFTPTPLVTRSSPNRPNTTPLPPRRRCRYPPNPGSSGWSSVEGPGPRPGRRHMIWERRWSTQPASYRKHAKI